MIHRTRQTHRRLVVAALTLLAFALGDRAGASSVTAKAFVEHPSDCSCGHTCKEAQACCCGHQSKGGLPSKPSPPGKPSHACVTSAPCGDAPVSSPSPIRGLGKSAVAAGFDCPLGDALVDLLAPPISDSLSDSLSRRLDDPPEGVGRS